MTHYEWLIQSVGSQPLDECIIWPFRCDRDGYGRVKFEHKMVGAHRLAFRLAMGRWPEPCGLHTCDTPGCVNPRHIFEGTNIENMLDRDAKGHSLKGTQQPQAKLTEDMVTIARQEYRHDGIGFHLLGKKYGVSRVAMRRAIVGITNWKHVGVGVPSFWSRHRPLLDRCKRGHVMNDNTCYIYKNVRQCKACTAIRAQNRQAREAYDR